MTTKVIVWGQGDSSSNTPSPESCLYNSQHRLERFKLDELKAALETLAAPPNLLVLDLSSGSIDLSKIVNDTEATCGATPLIVLTGAARSEEACAAFEGLNARFVSLPVDESDLSDIIDDALLAVSAEAIGLSEEHPGIVHRLAPELRSTVIRVASVDSSVLLTGESGTGKSTLAHEIHLLSERANRPFISVSCASLPRDLLEGELFGYERGAFTGAHATRVGRAELADGGTLFLDEVGDLPLDLQPKILTFLQDHVIHRLGSHHERKVDVRIIAATNRSLHELCSQGRFREDLLFRLNVLDLNVTPLRERRPEIPALAKSLMRRFYTKESAPPVFSESAIERLTNHDWPGNIRELENVIQRVIAFHDGAVVYDTDLKFDDRPKQTRILEVDELPTPVSFKTAKTLKEIERQAILSALHETDWNKAAAARRLDISEKSIYNKMRRFKLPATRPNNAH